MRLPILHERSERIRLVLEGEIDLAVLETLHDVLGLAIARAAATSGDCDVEVDLRAVTFLDCTAIGALVAARNSARSVGRDLYVSHPTQLVRRVLEVTDSLRDLTTVRSSVTQLVALRDDVGDGSSSLPGAVAVSEVDQVLRPSVPHIDDARGTA